ncbi:hypothetical protein chiPu_0023040, partial [Chiloscyllium punctatum]|nr:hypothetical protein [Chiloscyllium punctatum]
VLVVNLGTNKFLRQVDDEDSILPRKLQVALEHVLEMRTELASQEEEDSSLDSKSISESGSLSVNVNKIQQNLNYPNMNYLKIELSEN